MAYDVFVTAANADREMAKLVVRRLRALKMKVWYDAKSDDDVFDEKEARDVARSKAMLVLWSQAAVKSDFVRAAASMGYSMPQQLLVQAALDDVIPYEPFSVDHRYDLEGFTTRTTVEGFYGVVEELERNQGRSNLRAWMDLKADDRNGQRAWKAIHPDDPLSQEGRPVGVAGKPEQPPADAARPAVTAASLAGAAAAGLAAKGIAPGVTTSTLSGKPVPVATAVSDEDIGGMGWGTIGWILAGILAMLWLAWLWRTHVDARPLPGISNAGPMIARTCPPGKIPRSMLNILEPGPITDDTQD